MEELAHEFTVDAPVNRAWEVLTDIERIAPCMPGAQLTEVDGGTYHGLVKVKVGPITVQYKGTAELAEKDEAAHRVVLKAAGRDARGQGNASALVTAVMTEQIDGTLVSIRTRLTVSGADGPVRPGCHGRHEREAAAAVRRTTWRPTFSRPPAPPRGHPGGPRRTHPGMPMARLSR